MHRRGYRILHDLQEAITSNNHKLPYNLNEAVLGSTTEQRDRQNKPLFPRPPFPILMEKGGVQRVVLDVFPLSALWGGANRRVVTTLICGATRFWLTLINVPRRFLLDRIYPKSVPIAG